MKFACHTQKELSVSIKVSKEIVPFQQARVRIPNLGARCKKMFQLDVQSQSRIKSPTPTRSVLSNPTPR